MEKDNDIVIEFKNVNKTYGRFPLPTNNAIVEVSPSDILSKTFNVPKSLKLSIIS